MTEKLLQIANEAEAALAGIFADIDAVSMPKCLDTAMRKGAGTVEALQANMRAEIFQQCDLLQEKYRHVEIFPGPFVSVISTGCIEKARDISRGAKYNNFGIHGTGLSTAADSLAAMEKFGAENPSVRSMLPKAAFGGFDGSYRVGVAYGHRLFAQNVYPALKRRERYGNVQIVRKTYMNYVEFFVIQHFFIV